MTSPQTTHAAGLDDDLPMLIGRQRKSVEIGRVRIGNQVPTSNGKGTRPAKLNTFRLTSGSQEVIAAAAALFGGQVKPFEPERGQKGWEVITNAETLPVMVPPREQIVTQFYERWTAAGASHRCNGRDDQLNTETPAGAPGSCRCPFLKYDDGAPELDEDGYRILDNAERIRLSKLLRPQACKPHTRMSFLVPDLPGIGVWRFESTGEVFADEVADNARILHMAARQGVYLPAQIRLTFREIRRPGETPTTFPVVTLDVLTSIRAIAAGSTSGIGAALPPAPPQAPAKAIAAGPAPASADRPAPGGSPVNPNRAQEIAHEARDATDVAQVLPLMHEAKDSGLLDDEVYVPADDEATNPETDAYMDSPLRDYLSHRYQALNTAQQGADQ